MKRVLPAILVLLMMNISARADYWTTSMDRPIVCCDDRIGCQVLQTVMTGSFDMFDPENSLSVRVMSAALPQLTAVTEEDFLHFTDYFDVDMSIVVRLYHIALANCLWADIIISPEVEDPDEQNARTLLHLFLDDGDGQDVQEQRETIRAHTNDFTLKLIADKSGMPVQFVEYLIMGGEEQPQQTPLPE